jgi:NitT/TauT family transport system substrate-binding protein
MKIVRGVKFLAAVGSGAALLFMAACGGASTPAAGTTTPAAAHTSAAGSASSAPAASSGKAAAPSSLGTVTVGKAGNTLGATLIDLAKAKGFFAQRGIKVKDAVLHGSTSVIAALNGGSVQFGFIAASPLLLARQKGFKVITVAEATHGTPLQLVASKSLVTKNGLTASSPLKQRVEALNGGVMGNSGPTDEGAFKLLFKTVGVSPKVRFVHIAGQSEALAAMKNGELQAFFQSPPSSVEAVASGIAVDLVRGDEVPGWSNPVFQILVASAPWAQAHPAQARAVASAVGEAAGFMVAHPNQALAFEEHYFPTLKPQVLKASLAIMHFTPGGTMTAAQWAAARNIAVGEGFLPASVKVAEGTDWTNQYLGS